MTEENHKRKINRIYRRSLPHILPEVATIFFTYTLDGALPRQIIEKLRAQQSIEELNVKSRMQNETKFNHKISKLKSAYFGKYDHLLDNDKSGDKFLKEEKIAKLVSDSIFHLAKDKYELICFCIMSNHVHKIVREKDIFLGHLMQSHKGFTGKEANKLLKRSGPFWQRESFDMVIRDENQFAKKVRYVMQNPVAAKLVDDYRDWKFSYLNEEYQWIMDIV